MTFDRAPLGKRGYNEDQVDDFLDRIQATLAGKDTLTAEDVRNVEFDPAPFIRRGYHEDQVDEFLDLVVEELERRTGRATERTTQLTPVPPDVRQPPPPTEVEQTAPMLFSQPPSLPSPGTQPLKHDRKAASGPPNPSVTRPTDNPAGQHSTSKEKPATPVNGTPPPAAPAARPPRRASKALSEEATSPAPITPPKTKAAPGKAPKPPTAAPTPAAPTTAAPTTAVPTTAVPTTAAPTTAAPTAPTKPAAEAKPANPSATASAAPAPAPPAEPAAPAPAPPAAPASPAPAAPAEPVESQDLKAPASPAATPPDAVVAASVAPDAVPPASSAADASPAEPAAEAPHTTAPTSSTGEPDEGAASVAADGRPSEAPEPAPEAPDAIVTTHPAVALTAAPSAGVSQAEAEMWRDSEHLALPLPPAPSGERGYRPGDVERLVQLLGGVLADPEAGGADEVAALKLSRTFFVGQGYHVGAVDAVRQAWVDELRRRAR